MKKLEFTKILFVSLVLIGSVAVSSCGGKKKVVTQDDFGKEVITPCNDSDFPTTKTHFRATGISTSTDLSMAKRKATTDARANLAATINTTIKTVTDRYSNERQVGAAQEFEEKFESLTREVVNQEMNNVAIACNKTTTKEGKYTAFIAVEVAKDELLANIKDRISKDQKLQLDYDKMKFENIFNEEMDKMANERP